MHLQMQQLIDFEGVTRVPFVADGHRTVFKSFQVDSSPFEDNVLITQAQWCRDHLSLDLLGAQAKLESQLDGALDVSRCVQTVVVAFTCASRSLHNSTCST